MLKTALLAGVLSVGLVQGAWMSGVLGAPGDGPRGPGGPENREMGPPPGPGPGGMRGHGREDDDGPPPPPFWHHGRGPEGREPKMEKATFLGLFTRPVDPALRDQLDLPKGEGLIVEDVVADSPAKAAGFQVHDVVTRLNDQIIVNPEQLMVLVRAMKPDQSVDVTLIRKTKEIKVTVMLAEKFLPEMEGPMGPPPMGPMWGHGGPMMRGGMGPHGPHEGRPPEDEEGHRGPPPGGPGNGPGPERGPGPGPGGPPPGPRSDNAGDEARPHAQAPALMAPNV